MFPNRAQQLTITVGLIADMKVINPFDFFIENWAERTPFDYPKAMADDLRPYLRPVDEGDEGSGPGELVRRGRVISPCRTAHARSISWSR